MPAPQPVQREGDANSGGGIIVSKGHKNVLINGIPAARPYSKVTPHAVCVPKFPIHCVALVEPGAQTVMINGEPMIITGNSDTCGHARAGGSPNVRAV